MSARPPPLPFALYLVAGAVLGATVRLWLAVRLSPGHYIGLSVVGFREWPSAGPVAGWAVAGAVGLGAWYVWRRRLAGAPPLPSWWLPPLLLLANGWTVGPWLRARVVQTLTANGFALPGVDPLDAALAGFPPSLGALFVLFASLAFFLGAEALTLPPPPATAPPFWTPRRGWVLAGAVAVVFAAVFGVLNVRQLWAGHLGYTDSGFTAEALWNTLHGRFLHTNYLADPLLLADHFSPIWLALLPAFAVYPRHETLCVLSALLLAACVPLSYRLARRAGASSGLAAAFAVAVSCYPPLTLENSSFSYGFQAELVALPLLLAAYAHLPWGEGPYARRDFFWLCAGLGAALLCKESVALTVAATGLYLWWRTRRAAFGLPVLLVGVAWGVAIPKWVVPALKGGNPYFQVDHFYGHLGGSPAAVIWHVLRAPDYLLVQLADPLVLTSVAMLLLPLAGLALARPALLAVALPTGFFLIVSNSEMTRSVQFHYKITLLPALLAAAAAGLPAAADWLARGAGVPAAAARRGVVVALLVSAVTAAWAYGAGPWTRAFDPAWFDHRHPEAVRLRALRDRIPRDAVLYATHRAAAQFTDRPHLFIISAPYGPRHPPPPDYVLVYANQDTLWGNAADAAAAVEQCLADGRHVVLERSAYLTLVGPKPAP